MQYKLELLINKPRVDVWQAFIDPERQKQWQPSLTSIDLISGTRMSPGAVSKLTFQENNREFVLMETILHCEEPGQLDQTYENQFARNTVNHSFLEQAQDQTLWITETEYQFKTFLMKLMVPLYKKNLMARTEREMQCFKEMLESD